MEAVTVRGLEEGFSLGGEGETRWNGGMLGGWLGAEKAGKRFRLHQCKGGGRNKESVLGRVMEMGGDWEEV